MRTLANLRQHLERIDGRGYKAFKEIQGSYDAGERLLFIDHVQGDPFAAPSRVRVRLSQQAARLPGDLFATSLRRIALSDFLARRVRAEVARATIGTRSGSGKSGLVLVDAGGQEVLERTAVVVTSEWVELRLSVGLPAAGRRVLGHAAAALLCGVVAGNASDALRWAGIPTEEANAFVQCVENQQAIRDQLDGLGLVAFIANGSILPRESGVSDRPLSRDRAVPFRTPDALRACVRLPNPISTDEGPVTSLAGMGIPIGVTLVVGGGYHGKSTLLRALARCVYPHVPGDGREYVLTRSDAVTIRAEDGRRVEKVDIGPFIACLPGGRDTASFCSDDASGSTSQAANIVEAVESGARLLLLDEDTSATNFMVRDARMQALVRKADEPITPFVDRVRELHERWNVSTILVMGGCGDYFDVADTVIQMRNYVPSDVTAVAKRIADLRPTQRCTERTTPLSQPTRRVPIRTSFDPSSGRRAVRIDDKAIDRIRFGGTVIDLRCVEQLVDRSQTRAIAQAIQVAATRFITGGSSLSEVLDQLEQLFDEHGLDPLSLRPVDGRHPGDFARPRRHEVAAAINRLRTVRMERRAGNG